MNDKNSKPAIDKYISAYNTACEKLRPLLIADICGILKKISNDKGRFNLGDLKGDPDWDDMNILVETDRHTGDYGIQAANTFEISKDTDGLGRFSVETQDGYTESHWITIPELLDIRERLAAIKDSLEDEDFGYVLVDGTLIEKEDI